MADPGTPMRAPLSLLPLRLDGVVYEAGGRRIVDGVSTTLDAGPRTIVLGPNGAGKSVLLRLCHGLLAPTAGRIAWNSEPIAGGAPRQAMVFQRPVLLRRSAVANVVYALKLAHVPSNERKALAFESLAKVGLEAFAQRPARVMSGGEQQRLALARVWAVRPEVLFLDEPTASLDPGSTNEIENIILALHAAGTKIVMITHSLGQAQRLGDEIWFINKGRLAERSPTEQFFEYPTTAEAARFLEGERPW